jgi:hypothetical protein
MGYCTSKMGMVGGIYINLSGFSSMGLIAKEKKKKDEET